MKGLSQELRTLRAEGIITFLKKSMKYIDDRYFNYAFHYYIILIYSRIDPERTDPWSIIKIDPKKIEWSYKAKPYHGNAGGKIVDFDPIVDAGRVVSGSWDKQLQVKYQELPKYKAVHEHFVHGKSWEETENFNYLSEMVEKEERFDGCESQEDLRKRYRNIDHLYYQIREDGYKSRKDICRSYDYFCRLDLPKVHIARDGSFIHAGGSGNHRIAITRILNIPIEVRVVVRHKKWEQIRLEINNSRSIESLSEEARENLDHPDVSSKEAFI